VATDLTSRDGCDTPAALDGAALKHLRTGSTPRLSAGNVTIRGLDARDAHAFADLFSAEPVGRFLTPAPPTSEGFGRFIDWTRAQQKAGTHVCFALVPAGSDEPAGLIQIRKLESTFSTAEWGFVVGQPFWGTGLFINSAKAVMAFLFETVGVRRLEARTVVTNERANGALRKLGFTQEALLREGFCSDSGSVDQILWAMLGREWNARIADRTNVGATVSIQRPCA
jgi:ribosomal-protein-alanine N-acetyltransferase